MFDGNKRGPLDGRASDFCPRGLGCTTAPLFMPHINLCCDFV